MRVVPDSNIEAHIFAAFIAYCLQVALKNQARLLAPGLTARAILEMLSATQMAGVHLPATGGRKFILPRHTHPNADQQLLIQRLKLALPEQPPPRIQSNPLSTDPATAKPP